MFDPQKTSYIGLQAMFGGVSIPNRLQKNRLDKKEPSELPENLQVKSKSTRRFKKNRGRRQSEAF